ncbi:MAG: glycosyltransferase family 2 protein, partial [Flavobacteriaceae bacterium]|nr:glycosyltransferase family 2 protein [Flavobacteriaceae bacterium]
MFKTYATVIPAHNEEENLPSILEALQSQTLKPTQIIVVNDGSTDNTGDIARNFGCTVVDLPFHEKNWRGLPQLAGVINAGLRHVGEENEYVMILGADHKLPPKYAETIISRMNKNLSLVIASGMIKEDKMRRNGPPRGSGRVVRLSFWRPLGLHYPENYGWESWLNFKALQLSRQI